VNPDQKEIAALLAQPASNLMVYQDFSAIATETQPRSFIIVFGAFMTTNSNPATTCKALLPAKPTVSSIAPLSETPELN
jgi:hypothetical protein